ncbi:MAG: hypothetical protein ACE5LU_14515 [Anaerolineae bacterium]
MSTLWILFIIFAILGVATFLYAFRSLGPTQDVERRMIEMQDRAEEE